MGHTRQMPTFPTSYVQAGRSGRPLTLTTRPLTGACSLWQSAGDSLRCGVRMGQRQRPAAQW